jgi:hypothetical protein
MARDADVDLDLDVDEHVVARANPGGRCAQPNLGVPGVVVVVLILPR